MKFLRFQQDGRRGVGILDKAGQVRGRLSDDPLYPGDIDALLNQSAAALLSAGNALAAAPEVDSQSIQWLTPLAAPSKIICIGLNYRAHASEGGVEAPQYPAVFTRFNSSVVAHQAALLRPRESLQFDYEGELVVIIGRAGRRISAASALSHVAGYSIFNDGSVRDYQFKSPQWTMGKNFDSTGSFGPYLVTPDELPPGAAALRIRTRLNGQTLQDASTADLIFDVATLISLISQAVTLQPGDVFVTGTPSGVGFVRKPQLFMAPGDLCEVEIEGLGVLRNPVKDDVVGEPPR